MGVGDLFFRGLVIDFFFFSHIGRDGLGLGDGSFFFFFASATVYQITSIIRPASKITMGFAVDGCRGTREWWS